VRAIVRQGGRSRIETRRQSDNLRLANVAIAGYVMQQEKDNSDGH
jgi:hypothetical protein